MGRQNANPEPVSWLTAAQEEGARHCLGSEFLFVGLGTEPLAYSD